MCGESAGRLLMEHRVTRGVKERELRLRAGAGWIDVER